MCQTPVHADVRPWYVHLPLVIRDIQLGLRQLLCLSLLLSSSIFIHLLHSGLELFILTFFVTMSFRLWKQSVSCLAPDLVLADLPRTSMAGTILYAGICSVVLGDGRSCLCTPLEVLRQTSVVSSPLHSC